jgi:hypothetical protein
MNREQLIEQLQPIFDDFIDRIAAAIPDLVRAELVATIGKLTEPKTEPAPKKTRAPKQAKAPKRTKKSAISGPTCGKCGESGHNQRTCGKSETPAPTVVAKPPPPQQRSCRSVRRDRSRSNCTPRQLTTCLCTRSSHSTSDQWSN